MTRSTAAAPTARDRGSVLLLLPTAVLVVMILGAMSVDAAVRFQTQRGAVSDAQAIAHDAVSAVAPEDLRAGASPQDASLDDADIGARIAADVRARRLESRVRWRLDGRRVVVTVTRTTPLIFTGVVPGAPTHATLRGTASARLERQESS